MKRKVDNYGSEELELLQKQEILTKEKLQAKECHMKETIALSRRTMAMVRFEIACILTQRDVRLLTVPW